MARSEGETRQGPGESFGIPSEMTEDAAMPYTPNPGSERTAGSGVDAALTRVESTLMAIDGVEGVGRGRTGTGDDAIVIYVRERSVIARVQPAVEGIRVPVVFEVTGPIEAQAQ